VSGDQARLMRALYDQHAAALWCYALRLTGDRAAAQDVVQESMLRAWRRPEVLDQSERSARAWLFTVARRVVIDDWRSGRSRREIPTGNLPEQAGPDDLDAALRRWQMIEALRRLSSEHRQALVECYYRGRTVAEAAAVLGVPVGTIKSRCHYGLRALRLILAEMGVSRD
jgi:RNA polymerase sigma-70 factor (ECF subfamily)